MASERVGALLMRMSLRLASSRGASAIATSQLPGELAILRPAAPDSTLSCAATNPVSSTPCATVILMSGIIHGHSLFSLVLDCTSPINY